MEILQELGFNLIRALQTLSPALDGPMQFLTFLGRIEFYLLLLPFIYWALDRRLAVGTILILIVADLFGSNFKLLFHQPRPYWLGGVPALSEEPSYGIPSTHASDSLAVWGYLAYQLRRRWLTIGVILFVFLIGVSRLYLGMHFPHDVIFGWLIGGAVLVGFVKSQQRVAAWFNRQSLLAQIGLGFALSVAIIVIGQVMQMLLSGIPDPEAWRVYAAEARTPAYSFTLAGALFGLVAGYSLMKQRAPFKSTGPWLKRGGRYLLGIIGVLLIHFGLDFLFGAITPEESGLGYGLRSTRYAAVTFWVSFLAPWMFLKLNLADSEA